MRVLITGGAGSIGSHLAERCLDRGDSVCVVDDLSTGTLDNIIESPVRTIETNVNATEAVLRAAAREKTKVLLTSSSEVYGKRNTVPFRETDDLVLGSPDKGRWSYACSKAIGESLALAYYREQGVPAVIGGQDEISILDLARRVIARTGSESGVAFVPYDIAYDQGFEDMPRRVPGLAKIRDLIGFSPKIGLDAIIDSVAEYYRDRVLDDGAAEEAAPQLRSARSSP